MRSLRPNLFACLHVLAAIGLVATFSGTELALAMTLQLAVITGQIARSFYPPANWILKAAVAVVLLRATLMAVIPWWQDGMLDSGGFLPIYGIMIAILIVSYFYLKEKSPKLASWLEGAILHLFVVAVAAQSHYWLLDGSSDWFNDGFKLSIVYSIEALAVSGVYLYRAKRSEFLKPLYQSYATVLYGLGILFIVVTNTVYSPLFANYVSGSAAPVFNWLSLGWLVPACLITALAYYGLQPGVITQRQGYSLGGIILAIWLGMSIRQFWQQDVMTVYVPTSMAEQITYSFTGITAGLLLSLWGVMKSGAQIKLLGLSILAAVVVKVVLIDTSELEGVLRAMSYLVLGVVLVGLGWIFQKLSKVEQGQT